MSSPPARDLRPPTLVEAVLHQLREDLVQDRYAPGEPIRVDHVAAAFGVSAFPVREALRVLLAEGRVQYAPHRGFRVTELTREAVEEMFLMCRLLEAESMRRGVAALDDAGVDRIRSLLAKLLSPPRGASLWDSVAVHREFHFVPIVYAQLPLIEVELRRLWDHTEHYRLLFAFGDEQTREQMNAEHTAIAEACASRDPDLAVELVDLHRLRALEYVVRQTKQREDGSPEKSGPPR